MGVYATQVGLGGLNGMLSPPAILNCRQACADSCPSCMHDSAPVGQSLWDLALIRCTPGKDRHCRFWLGS